MAIFYVAFLTLPHLILHLPLFDVLHITLQCCNTMYGWFLWYAGLYSPANDAGDVSQDGAGTEAKLVCLFKELRLEASCQPELDTQVL